jgi:hypothetical protein
VPRLRGPSYTPNVVFGLLMADIFFKCASFFATKLAFPILRMDPLAFQRSMSDSENSRDAARNVEWMAVTLTFSTFNEVMSCSRCDTFHVSNVT